MRHEVLKWGTGLVFVVVVMICAAVESKEALCRERCGEVSKGKHSLVLQLTRRVEAKVYFIYCNQWSVSVDAKLTFVTNHSPDMMPFAALHSFFHRFLSGTVLGAVTLIHQGAIGHSYT